MSCMTESGVFIEYKIKQFLNLILLIAPSPFVTKFIGVRIVVVILRPFLKIN